MATGDVITSVAGYTTGAGTDIDAMGGDITTTTPTVDNNLLTSVTNFGGFNADAVSTSKMDDSGYYNIRAAEVDYTYDSSLTQFNEFIYV